MTTEQTFWHQAHHAQPPAGARAEHDYLVRECNALTSQAEELRRQADQLDSEQQALLVEVNKLRGTLPGAVPASWAMLTVEERVGRRLTILA